MANKIKLGNRPKTFKPFYVKFPMPDGTEGRIQVTFKYFTKIESGKLFDDLIAEAKANAKTDEEKAEVEAAEVAFSLQEIMEKNRDHNSDYLLRVVDGWDLDEPLSLETLQQLDDEIPAATVAIMTGFREAAQQGRLGN
jgi:hypothetical protein